MLRSRLGLIIKNDALPSNMEFYELNLGAFNKIFCFLLNMDLPYCHVPKGYNPNAFWHELSGDHMYDTSNSKGIAIRNPSIRVV